MNKLESVQLIRVKASELDNQTQYDKLIPETTWSNSWFEFTKRGHWSSLANINGWQLRPLDSTHIRFERDTAATSEGDVEFDIWIYRGDSTVKVLHFVGAALTEGSAQLHDITSLSATQGTMFYVPTGWKDSDIVGRKSKHCIKFKVISDTQVSALIYDNGGSEALDSYAFSVVTHAGVFVQHKDKETTADTFDITLGTAVTMAQTRLIGSGAYEADGIGNVDNERLMGRVHLDDTTSILGFCHSANSLEVLANVQAISDSSMTVDRGLFVLGNGVADIQIAITDRTLARRTTFLVTCASPGELAQNFAARRVRQNAHTLKFNNRAELEVRVASGSEDGSRNGAYEAILWPVKGLQDEGYAADSSNAVSATVAVGSGSNRMLWAVANRRTAGGNNDSVTSILHDGDAPSATIGDQDGNGGDANNRSSQAVYLWYNADLPTAGSYSLALICHADVEASALIWGYCEDLKQVAPASVDTAVNNDSDGAYITSDPAVLVGFTGNQEDIQVNVVPDADSMVLHAFTGRNQGTVGVWAAESGQTLLGQDDSNGNVAAVWSSIRKTTAASVQMDVLSDGDGLRFGVNSNTALEFAPAVPPAEEDVVDGLTFVDL